LFKITIQGVSLWHFHMCMYYSLIWFIISIFFPLYLSLLMAVSSGLRILCSFLYSLYINHIRVFNFLLLPSPSHMWNPLSMTCFSYCCICIRSVFSIWEKMWLLTFCTWLISFKINVLFHPFTCRQQNFILLCCWIKFHCK
jgi:hypothetical protein